MDNHRADKTEPSDFDRGLIPFNVSLHKFRPFRMQTEPIY